MADRILFQPENGKRPRALAVGICSFVIALVLCSPSLASGVGPVSPDAARSEAGRLIERVWSLTLEDPSRPAAQPDWGGAVPGEPIEVHSVEGLETAFYLVPVLGGDGRVLSLISVDAGSGEWTWYSEEYSAGHFPPVDLNRAIGEVAGMLRGLGIREPERLPRAVSCPDGLIYWSWDVSDLDLPFERIFLPIFDGEGPSTDLAAPPWERMRTLSTPGVNEGRSRESLCSEERARPSMLSLLSVGGLPAYYDIPGVPYHQQETNFWCGVACLEMVMDYYGPDIPQDEIAGVANAVSPDGCYNDDLLRASQFSSLGSAVRDPELHGYTARSWGYAGCQNLWSERDYDRRYERIKWLISQDCPVLVLQWPDQSHVGGHYRVVKGYDDGAGVFIVHDPWYTEGPNVRFNQAVFVDDLWVYSDRWGMICPPWDIALGVPGSLEPGDTFTVTAQVDYLGPYPFDGQCYVCEPQATISLPGGYSLLGEPATHTLPGIDYSGSSDSVSWQVRAQSTEVSPHEIGLEARGKVLGDPTTSYPGGYQDLIGGDKSTTDVRGGRSFYFAEGTTRQGYEEWLCIRNSSVRDAQIEINYMLETGDTHVQRVTVAGQSRATVSVNQFIAQYAPSPYQDVSAKVTSTNGAEIVVERPMYFDLQGISGGHVVTGARCPRSEWYFAEGNTYDWNQEWLCLQNPGEEEAEVLVECMTNEGEVLRRELVVPPHTRHTESVNGLISPVRTDVSMAVTSNQPVVAERPQYFRYRDTITGGSVAMGASGPSTSWYLAEGTTRWWADEWITVMNPNQEEANITITYMPEGSDAFEVPYAVGGESRLTVDVNRDAGEGLDTSALVVSDHPVICERPMYFAYGSAGGDKWPGGHVVVGVTAPTMIWDFAEGCTRSEKGEGFEEYLCLQNPGDTPARIDITYTFGTGETLNSSYVVEPESRLTVNVAGDVGAGRDVSARVASDVPVVCERPMYFDLRGAVGGHDDAGFNP